MVVTTEVLRKNALGIKDNKKKNHISIKRIKRKKRLNTSVYGAKGNKKRMEIFC